MVDSEIAKLLSVGDMRTKGASDMVVSMVLEDKAKFNDLFKCLSDPQPGLRMRSADALEKLTRLIPFWQLPIRKN